MSITVLFILEKNFNINVKEGREFNLKYMEPNSFYIFSADIAPLLTMVAWNYPKKTVIVGKPLSINFLLSVVSSTERCMGDIYKVPPRA